MVLNHPPQAAFLSVVLVLRRPPDQSKSVTASQSVTLCQNSISDCSLA